MSVEILFIKNRIPQFERRLSIRSGTWMMTGNGVMHNGTTVIEQYGQNLDRLQVGDRVGVVRKDDGTLHFWVNGVDQGPGATNVPERVYGVIGKSNRKSNLLKITN